MLSRNPLESSAGITGIRSLVPNLDELDRYPYCGHSVLMGRVEREWQQTDYVLTTFGKRMHDARNVYRGFMEEGLPQGRREELVGGGLVRSLGGWSAVKKNRNHTMSDERILGDADFVDAMLSQAGEVVDRQYKLNALGYDLHRIAERAAEIFNMNTDEIFLPGRQNLKVKARSLVCFWAARELGMSLSELARAFEMSVPGIGYAVERGEKLARSNKFNLII